MAIPKRPKGLGYRHLSGLGSPRVLHSRASFPYNLQLGTDRGRFGGDRLNTSTPIGSCRASRRRRWSAPVVQAFTPFGSESEAALGRRRERLQPRLLPVEVEDVWPSPSSLHFESVGGGTDPRRLGGRAGTPSMSRTLTDTHSRSGLYTLTRPEVAQSVELLKGGDDA